MKNVIFTSDISGDIIKKAAINSRLIEEQIAVKLEELFIDDSKISVLMEMLLSNPNIKDDSMFLVSLLEEFMCVQAFKTELYKLMNDHD